MWLTVSELVKCPSLPSSERGCRKALDKLTNKNPSIRRKKTGTKAFEYNSLFLSEKIQKEIQEIFSNAVVQRKPTLPAVKQIDLDDVTSKQRDIADARMALVAYVQNLEQVKTRDAAIKFICNSAKFGQLPDEVMALVERANCKNGKNCGRVLSHRTLYSWVLDYNKAKTPEERLKALVPSQRKADRVSSTSTDAINGSQLYLALNTLGYVGDTLVTNVLGGNANIVKNGNTAGSLTMSNIGGTGQDTLHDAIAAVNTAAAQKTTVVAGKNMVVKNTGSTTHPSYTVETTEDVEFKTVKVGENQEIEMNKDGIAAGSVYINTQEDDITGLSNTTLGQDNFAADGRAATEEQLSETVDNVVKVLGGNAQNENGEISMSNIGDTGENTIHDAIKAINATAKAAKTTVEAGENIEVTTKTADDGSQTYTVATKKDVKFNSALAGGTKIDHNGLTFVNDEGTAISNSPIISKTGIDAGHQKVKQVQNGDITKASKDAVNGGQLFAQGEGVKNIIGGNTTYDSTTGKYTNQDIGGTGKNTIHDAIKASQTEVTAGKNMNVTSSKGENGQTVYHVATQDNLAFTEVKVGPNVTINETGLQVGNINLNAATNKITGIAKGEVSATSTEAVNGSQLYQTHQNINKLDKNLRAGIAGANAAAGLPQAYLPGKSMIALAAGTYKGENALALGVSRISDNGKVIIKLTGNTNSRGDVGGSIGAGYQW
ncbi:autotransporter adhesin [Pasteurella multocida subsp. multocida OH4807]|nr:autotransporter adhesin [Pasteurella multocida subsp. multocida OH4807]